MMRSETSVGLLLGAWALIGCGVFAPSARSTSDRGAPASHAKLIQLAIDTRELKQADGTLVYTPESRRMKAEYDHYIFDAADTLQVLGDGAGVVLAEVEILDTVERRTTPEAGAASPQGGFRHRDHHARLVRVVERGIEEEP